MIAIEVLRIYRQQHPVPPVYLHLDLIDKSLIFTGIESNKVALKNFKVVDVLAGVRGNVK
jgi:hypothetical protein